MNTHPKALRTKALELYASGLGSTAVGQMLNIAQTTVLKWAKVANINRAWRVTPEERERILQMYNSGTGIRKITWALQGTVSGTGIRQVLKKAGVLRNWTEAARIPREGTRIPSDFLFSPLTPAKAWVLGLLFSDGSIRKDGWGATISIGHVDMDAPAKISAVLGAELHSYRHRSAKVSNIQINSKRLCIELQSRFGLVPNKSLVMEWPENIPEELLPHFVRGLYDGDGSWFARKDRNSLKSAYASCSRRFVEALRSVLIAEVGVSSNTNVRCQGRANKRFGDYLCHDYYSFELGHTDSVALGEWMYRDSTDGTRYARKHERWRSLQRPSFPKYGHQSPNSEKLMPTGVSERHGLMCGYFLRKCAKAPTNLEGINPQPVRNPSCLNLCASSVSLVPMVRITSREPVTTQTSGTASEYWKPVITPSSSATVTLSTGGRNGYPK